VVFDPETVRDTATYDQPHGVSEGIAQVFVNGACAYRGGEARVLARAGRMLTRAGAA